jgi:hypothetical protein
MEVEDVEIKISTVLEVGDGSKYFFFLLQVDSGKNFEQ